MSWESFVDAGKAAKLGRDSNGEIEWRRQAFDWPIWILFSSGTTGEHLFPQYLVIPMFKSPHAAKVDQSMRTWQSDKRPS